MHITQWGEYGVHCALYLAQKNVEGITLVPAIEIAEAQGIALDYAQQILQRLRKNQIVESVRGPQGGYRLARPAAEINLRDIMMAAEGDTFEVICDVKPLTPERCGSTASCNLRPIWHGLKQAVNSYLIKFSLEDLLNKPGFVEAENKPIQISRSV